ncbi:MAG: hypothetical protein LAQ69_30215 [Acidobacteriia bacterium]|nr:hypothetical protein [Terriglobia bacterium]
MNALKSGIYSKSIIILGEDPAQLATLLQEYFQRYRPAVPEQREQVDILVCSTWTLRRLAAAEAQVWTKQSAATSSTATPLSATLSTTATAPSPASNAWSIPPSATTATPSTSSNASRHSRST